MFIIKKDGEFIAEFKHLGIARHILTLPAMGTAVIVYDKDEIKRINEERNNGNSNTKMP